MRISTQATAKRAAAMVIGFGLIATAAGVSPVYACGGSYTDPVGYSVQARAHFSDGSRTVLLGGWKGIEREVQADPGKRFLGLDEMPRNQSLVGLSMGEHSATVPAEITIDPALATARLTANSQAMVWDASTREHVSRRVIVDVSMHGEGALERRTSGASVGLCGLSYWGVWLARPAVGIGSISIEGVAEFVDAPGSAGWLQERIA